MEPEKKRAQANAEYDEKTASEIQDLTEKIRRYSQPEQADPSALAAAQKELGGILKSVYIDFQKDGRNLGWAVSQYSLTDGRVFDVPSEKMQWEYLCEDGGESDDPDGNTSDE